MSHEHFIFPFSAIVGQDGVRKALLLNAINPRIGGVLIRGEKGTAKSIAVRGLAALLPEIQAAAGCPFSCDPSDNTPLCPSCASRVASGESIRTITKRVPLVELPVGATEDRVLGSIDLERAIRQGEKHFEPGLLARANRGILYIDEVNLLDDHLVDILLDSAAMGINVVEREGVSFVHPAQFILVGTMNPEEGELRPQLLDRFGLAVEATGIHDKGARKEIVRRRIAFEQDPAGFAASWASEEQRLRERVLQARQLLAEVRLREPLLDLIAHICDEFMVSGHRADITIYKTAVTLAAYYGRSDVTPEDVREAAELALLHRRRKQPFEDPGLDREKLDESIACWQSRTCEGEGEEDAGDQGESSPGDAGSGAMSAQSPSFPSGPEMSEGHLSGANPSRERVLAPDPPYPVVALVRAATDSKPRRGSGRRSRTRSDIKSGRYVRSVVPRSKVTDLAVDATLRAAAPWQSRRPRSSSLVVEKADLRQKVRERRVGNLILFCLDASGSMGALERMKATKGAVLSLLIDVYQRRDRVGLVVFRGERAELVVPLTGSAEVARKYLLDLPVGGKTPLAHGLHLSLDVLTSKLSQERQAVPLLVLVSDGRANVSLRGGSPVEEAKQVARAFRAAGISAVAIDTEADPIRLGLVKEVCREMAGVYLRLEQLRADYIVHAVRLGIQGQAGNPLW